MHESATGVATMPDYRLYCLDGANKISRAEWIDAKSETYGNTAKLSLDAFSALIDDVRSGRQIKGG